MFVVLANATFASYFQGGGHWTWLLQYPLGLKQLGHRVFWLEVMRSTDNAEADSQAVRNFFQRMAKFDLEPDAAVLVTPNTPMRNVDQAKFHGRSAIELARIARDADLLWNFWYALEDPFLQQFSAPRFY